MSEDAGKKSGINWLALSLLSLLIAAAAGAAYLYLPALMPQTSTDIVMIRAEEGPFKTKPVDAGGKIITNQDSKVMRMLGDLTPETEEVETLLPPSDAPELPPVAIEPLPESPQELETEVASQSSGESSGETSTVPELGTKTENGIKSGDKTGTETVTATQLADANVQNSVTDAGDAAPEAKNGSETKDAPDAKDAAAPQNPEKPAKTIIATPKPTKPKKPGSQPITTSRVAADPNEPTYMVQLAAFRKEDIAAEQAGLLLKKHEKRLQGATLGTISIDTGDNGIFWRVVSEPLPREAADTICASLKRAGQDCILRKFTSPSQ
jgi:hypothetical protein